MKPLTVRLGRRRYTLHAPYDTVLFVYQTLRRSDLMERDKLMLCSDVLFRRPPHSLPLRAKALEEALSLLAGDAPPSDDEPPLMDFFQDAPFIRAAFMQQYGIDLEAERGRMSWPRFVELLAGLTDATMFIRIVLLRGRPMPKPTRDNAEERRALAQAKARFALREDESAAMRRLARQMNALADGLKAKAGETHGGS